MKKVLTTTLHRYYFNIEFADQKENYEALKKNLQSIGLTMFDSMNINSKESRNFQKQIESLDGKDIHLETEFLFNNQWNTVEGLRLFDWSEEIYPNKRIKSGYWLVPTGEMKEAREEQKICGYCGKRYNHSPLEWCTSCLASECLTENELYLLKLYTVAGNESRYGKTVKDIPPVDLKERFLIQQRDAGKKRIEQKIESAKKDIESKRTELIKEEKALNWLLSEDLFHLFENMIYYNHTDTFCFGWRNSIAGDEKTALQLKRFPFKYEIK